MEIHREQYKISAPAVASREASRRTRDEALANEDSDRTFDSCVPQNLALITVFARDFASRTKVMFDVSYTPTNLVLVNLFFNLNKWTEHGRFVNHESFFSMNKIRLESFKISQLPSDLIFSVKCLSYNCEEECFQHHAMKVRMNYVKVSSRCSYHGIVLLHFHRK